MSALPAQDALLDAAAVASLYSIHVKSVSRFVKAGRIPRPVEHRRRYTRWSKAEIMQNIAGKRVRPPPVIELPLWSTPAELSCRWPVSKSTIVRWLNVGKLQGKRFGDKWGVHRAAVEQFERDGIPRQQASAKPDMTGWDNLPQYV